MKTTQISYSELAKRVGDCVLFNNHNVVDEYWYEGFIESPLLRERMDARDTETRADKQKEIDESKDEAEKAKLIEELENDFEPVSILDYAGDIYQTYAINENGAEYLLNHTSELVSYSEVLGLYLWHIGHYGTSWTGVYTTLYEWDYEENHDYILGHNDIIRYKIG